MMMSIEKHPIANLFRQSKYFTINTRRLRSPRDYNEYGLTLTVQQTINRLRYCNLSEADKCGVLMHKLKTTRLFRKTEIFNHPSFYLIHRGCKLCGPEWFMTYLR